MKEGFDVAMEMSGSPAAAHRHTREHVPRRQNRPAGHHAEETAINWNTVVFNGLTIKGIYGREMFETWYKMTAMLQSGLDITPLITHRFHYSEYRAGLRRHALRRVGQGGAHLDK